jgi:hypothetical protein
MRNLFAYGFFMANQRIVLLVPESISKKFNMNRRSGHVHSLHKIKVFTEFMVATKASPMAYSLKLRHVELVIT